MNCLILAATTGIILIPILQTRPGICQSSHRDSNQGGSLQSLFSESHNSIITVPQGAGTRRPVTLSTLFLPRLAPNLFGSQSLKPKSKALMEYVSNQ